MVVGDAPVSGDVVFRWSAWRYVAAAATLAFVASAGVSLSASLLSSAISGRTSVLEVASDVVYVTLYTLLFPLFSWLHSHARPAGVRFSSNGVELAAERRDVVVVPYTAAASARVRWVWPVAMLDVFVDSADESRVLRIDRDGRRPLRKRKGDRLCFSIPIAGLRSAAEIRSELRRHGLGE